MSVLRYVVKRIVLTIPTLFALSLIIFYTTTFFPATKRVYLYIPDSPYRHPGHDVTSVIPELIEKYHLNDPFFVQYFIWLSGVLRGNLGYSWTYGGVSEAILDSFSATAEIVIYAAPVIVLCGYKLGTFSAKRAHAKGSREDVVDFAVRSFSILGYSIPQFCLALLLLVVFYLFLGWFQPGRLGTESLSIIHSEEWTQYTGLYTFDAILNGNPSIFLDALKHLVLPVTTLVIQMFPIVVRVTRSSMLEELSKPYIISARAKGLDNKAVARHAEKNSLTSVLTISGILLASMLTGVIVTEHVFLINGIGSMVVKAAQNLDYPILVGVSLVFCLIFALVNLIVDVAYAYINPRIKT